MKRLRLDKYLKVSRIIKRRPIAKEVSDAGKITINGRVAKASTEVKPGDILSIRFGSRFLEVEIIDCKENIKAAEAKELYKVLKQEKISYTQDWEWE